MQIKLPTGGGVYYKKLGISLLIFLFAFSTAFISASLLNPTNPSNAESGSNTIASSPDTETFYASTTQPYYVSINSNDISMDLKTSPTGNMTVVSSTVRTATNSPSGYKLYLGISPEDISGTQKTTADKQKNGLYLDGDLSRTDGQVIEPVAGTGATSKVSPSITPNNPAALTDNTWGYAVDKNSTGAPEVWQSENHTTMNSTTPTSDKFAAIPTVGNEELI